MKKLIVSICILLITLSNAYSQKIIDRSTSKRSTWLKEPPIGKYFNYFSGMASSKRTLDEAKDLAISDVLSEIIMKKEVIVESNITTFEEETEYELISRINKEIKLKGTSTAINGLEKEEEYWETVQTKTDILYRYWILMKIPKKEYMNFNFTKIALEQNYGLTPIVKSIFVPGWGQIHKKETNKGILFLSGFAVTLTSGFITNKISISYEQDAKNANGADWIDYYNDLSDQYYLVSMVLFVFSGAIYGYNVFDAISAKGAKIYAFNDTNNLQIVFNNKSSKIVLKFSIDF